MSTFGRLVFLLAALALVSDIEAMTGHEGHGGGVVVSQMVKVPAGEFIMGSSAEEVGELKRLYGKRDLYKDHPFDAEVPRRKVFVKEFYIDAHEVTVKEYSEFVYATGYNSPRNWRGGFHDESREKTPVIYVSRKDAEAYAKWAGKRLPTAVEWEKAARGPEGRVFPWGDQFDPYKAATAESDMQAVHGTLCTFNSAGPVMMAVGDVSPYGAHDMAGNVREWTSTNSPSDPQLAVTKGAAWLDLSVNARAAHIEYAPQGGASHIIGFRCAKDAG